MDKLNFGTKLIEFRKAKGLTQEEVAERCKITTRTIQRIESGKVEPRAFTIKIISESLGFDFYIPSSTDNEVITENQNSYLENHNNIGWYLKDLFNLKTKTMKKISILSTFAIMALLCVSIFNGKAQSDDLKKEKSLIIQLNEDKSVKRVEAAFTHNLDLDSLVKIKKDLQAIEITIHYKKIEFDVHNLLVRIACEVICNDGFSGSFEADVLHAGEKNMKFGFYRDYSPDARSPFGTGLLDEK